MGSYEKALLSVFGKSINLFWGDQDSTEYYPLKLNANNLTEAIPCN